jgi:hypothetical protein
MRIIISGGTGLIGRALSAALVGDGHTVIVLTRNPTNVQGMPNAVQLRRWDGKTGEGWAEVIDSADAIVNLAGEGIADSRWSAERKRRIGQSRIQAGNALYSAIKAAANKPKVFIQASAVGYYGTHQDEIISETSAVGNDFLAKVCFDWEAASAPVKHLGVRRPVIRTGVVLSNAGGAFPKQAAPFKFFIGGHLGSGKQWYPWIHIDDEVNAIRFLLEEEKADGAYNLTAPNPLTNRQFSEVLGKVMGRPLLAPVPAFVLKTLFGEMSTVLLDGQRAIPLRLQEAGFQFKYPTAEEALKQLLK